MTSVEKRHSGHRKHRKHSDGAHSDTSSGGSFLDETDREVSSLTDRAFRSLCIGDEAVYNDSDLGGTSSPSVQREKQLAFSQSSHGWDTEALKRAAHERFSLRVQQYGEDRMQGGPYGTQTQGGLQWEGYGERTERGVSATFQRSFVDMSQQEESQGDEQLSLNGPMELGGSQHRRSRSRVSSLIKAFSSEGYRDANLREWNTNEASWDKSALMSIQRELSEFSDACHQNFNSGPFSPPGSISSRDNNFYSSEMAAAVAHMDSTSSFMRTSHSTLSAFNTNSSFFIHSEFSPFKLWRDHNRFPFQQGEVTGFMPHSDFPRWYETPMYKELSLGPQPPEPGMYTERGARPQRKTLEPVAPPPPPRSTSSSSVLQKASALEKRCESELTGQYHPPWKQTQGSQSMNRLPSQRPSTVSPTGDLSRRVRDTLSSMSKLQQKITMMTSEQSVTVEMAAKQQGMLNSYDSLIPFSTVGRNVASSMGSSTTPFNISQLLTPVIPPAYQDTEILDAMSPPSVEHPPVRSESRGGTPDIRSSYKSRATSLLFNLKDNRKRVKSTYSPPKFKGPEMADRSKQHINQNEPRDTIIDMPDFPDPDMQIPQVLVQEEPGYDGALQEQCSRIPPPAGYNSQSITPNPYSVLNTEYKAREYLTAQMHGDMVPHGGFSGFPQGTYDSNQLINGLNRQEDLSPFSPFKMGQIDKREPQAVDAYGRASSEKLGVYNTLPITTSPLTKHNISPKPFYSTTDTARSNIDSNSQHRGYVLAKTSTEQNANKSIFTNVDGYEQVKESRYGYNAVSYQDSCSQQAYVSTTSSQAAESLGVEDRPRPVWKGEIAAYAQSSQTAQEQSWNDGTSYHPHNAMFHAPYQPLASNESVLKDQSEPYSNQDPGMAKAKYEHHRAQQHEGHETKDNYPTQNYYPYGKMEQEYRKQQMFHSKDTKNAVLQETAQKKYVPKLEENEALRPQQIDFKQQHDERDKQRQLPSSAEGGQCNENAPTMAHQIKAETPKAEQIKVDHTETEPPKTLQAEGTGRVQVGQPSPGSSGEELIIEGRPSGERHKAEDMKAEWAMGGLGQQVKAKDYNLEHVVEKQAEEGASEGQTGHVKDKLGKAAPDETENKQEQAESDNHGIQQLNSELAKGHQTQQYGVKQSEDRQADRESIVENIYEVKEIEQSEAEQNSQVAVEQAKVEEEKKELCGKIKTEHMEQAKEDKSRGVLSEAGELNTNTEQTQTEQAKVQLVRAEQAKAELCKIEKMKSESAKSKTKQADTEQVKLEPTKVEHAKTELAKARAELAKIKEKMRGEQKDRVAGVSIEEGNVANKSTPEKFETAENKKYQQNEDLFVNNSYDQVKADRGGDDYEHLREKYGWSNTDESQKRPLVDDTVVEAMNNKESKDETNPGRITIDKIGQEQSLSPTKYDEVRENQYVYSESSKEFKLSSANDLDTDGNRRHNNSAFNDKAIKDDQAMNDNSEKREPPDYNILLLRNSDSAKSLPLERKPSKDAHSTPYRALSYKERAQARQEILTSKIKAHAEKEISAIKEKGLSKNPTKHLVSGQVSHVRQKPPPLETSKGHDSTGSNNIAPKQQMGASEIRTVPLKSEDTVVQPSTEHKQMESKAQAADEDSRHKLTKVDQCGIESTTQSRTPAHFNLVEKESTHGESHAKQKEGFESKVSNKELPKVNKVGSQAEAVVSKEGGILETQTTNNVDGESDAIPEDSAPSLKLVLGQTETTTADDDLQIMGIRIIVRERNPSVSDGQEEDAHEAAKTKISPETQPLLFRQGVITQKAKDYTNKNPIESSAKSPIQDAIETQQHTIVQTSVNEDKEKYDSMSSKCEQMTIQGTSQPVENLYDENNGMTGQENVHISMGKQDTRAHSGEQSQVEEELHIDGIAIRVVPRVIERENQEMAENHPVIKIPPSSMGAVNENKPAALPRPGTETNVSKDEHRAKISLEAQHTSPSDRQGTHSLRFGDEHNAQITTRENMQVKSGTPEKPMTVEATMMDEDYFQLQGATETNQREVHLSSNVGNMSNAVSQRTEEPGAKESEEIASVHPENKASMTTDRFNVSGNRMAESTAENDITVHSKRMHSEVKDEQASKQGGGTTQTQSKFSARMKTDEDVHVRKQDTECWPHSSATERQPANSIHSTRDNAMQENVNYKQKPKDKASSTPEISAIADYARLKVIAAEGSPDTTQDFHPGKKEGFFPLIQTRPSRRPVFSSETQDLSAKEKMLPKEPEVSAKVSKEPKAVVFSTMEQENKRTGMFRLGDKENKLPDVKLSEGIADADAHQSHSHHLPTSTSASHPHPIQGQTQNFGSSGGAQKEEETRMKQKEEEHASKVAEERREKLRQERLAAQREEEIKAKRQEAERKAEEERRAKQREEELRMKWMMEEKKKAAELEEAKKAAQREEERRAKERQAIAVKLEEERREKQKEMERKAEEERKAKQREMERKAEEERRAKQKEMERKAEEERRAKEREAIAAKREQERIEKQRELERREEEERRAKQAVEEMRRQQIEEERRVAQREEERRAKEREAVAAKIEEERRERQRQAERRAEEEKRAREIEEQKRARKREEEEERRAAQIEEERRIIRMEEERKERARKEEMIAAQREEEERRRAVQIEEEERRAAQLAEERRIKQMEEERKAAQLEEERKERQRRAAQREEERRRAAQIEEEERKERQRNEERLAAQRQEEERRAVQLAEERRIKQMEEERKAAQIEEEIKERQRRAAQREEERRKAAQQEEEERSRAAQVEEERKERQRMAARREEGERRRAAQLEGERKERQRKEESMVAQIQEERRRAAQIEEEESDAKHREEQRAKEIEEERQAMQEKERRAAQREDRRDKRHAAQRTEALQYYDISTVEGNSRPPRSPLPFRRRAEPSGVETAEDAGSYSRPHATPSPAPSASRSNASSPAFGAKPTMFKVKDNTFRGASCTRSVKPRFHKNLGEDFRVGSPLDGWRGSQVAEEEQDKARRSAGTPIQHDGFTGPSRFSTFSTQDHSAPLLEYRPYNRRSIALDEDDSRSILSNMSEDMESFATSAADLAELRGIYDYDRPESACSFSSDVSRSLGKPPSVPAKTEKALRRAKRLTQRRIKKELSKTGMESPAEEKPLHTDSGVPLPTTELHSSSDFPVLSSPHFSAPISLAHAPTQDSSAPSSHAPSRPSSRSFHASPHHSPPVSLPNASPHHSPPISLQKVPSVPRSPTLHRAGRPSPVTQYQVEPGYSQNFPVTQRKVLQDPGSGQYYVVDMPVQVKAKTFFDPETGKYVQLNVRQTAQGGSPPQSRPKQQAQPQQPARPQSAHTGSPHTLSQGHPGHPQHHQSSLPAHRSSSGMPAASTLPEDSAPARQSQSYGYRENEWGQDSHEHNCSPEQTLYMDTACEPGKTRTTAHNTHKTEQAMRSLQPHTNNTATPPNIITMSELEDFMDASDW